MPLVFSRGYEIRFGTRYSEKTRGDPGGKSVRAETKCGTSSRILAGKTSPHSGHRVVHRSRFPFWLFLKLPKPQTSISRMPSGAPVLPSYSRFGHGSPLDVPSTIRTRRDGISANPIVPTRSYPMGLLNTGLWPLAACIVNNPGIIRNRSRIGHVGGTASPSSTLTETGGTQMKEKDTNLITLCR